MTNNLDTLATALYVRIDDLLKQSPQLAPWRPAVGICPQLSDAELVTLAVLQALLGFTSEARWLRYAHAHLRHELAAPIARAIARMAVAALGLSGDPVHEPVHAQGPASPHHATVRKRC